MKQPRWLTLSTVLVSMSWGLLQAIAASAQPADVLTRAEVYRLRNRVQLIPSNQTPRPARISDILVPRDAIRTASSSRVELLFNEGSLARIGSSAVFRFVPGLRRYQLANGTIRAETIFELNNGLVLIVTSPGSVVTQTQTPQSRIEIFANDDPVALSAISKQDSQLAQLPPISPPDSASAVLIFHEEASNTTQVFALTNSSVRVSNPNSENTTSLRAGQTVSVIDGAIGLVQNFDLERFYQTSGLAVGLGPGQENLLDVEIPAVREILNQARTETLNALAGLRLAPPTREFEGLCIATLRGTSATPRDCITHDSDEPIRRFQDRRDLVRPSPTQEQPPAP
ncbi:hypothetical protein QQ054_31060, partial [Oscillatoria amoena NRMC-F 0135]|nr:hypothetical protein [Oscillatoria amoena NRMC-F 0135]